MPKKYVINLLHQYKEKCFHRYQLFYIALFDSFSRGKEYQERLKEFEHKEHEVKDKNQVKTASGNYQTETSSTVDEPAHTPNKSEMKSSCIVPEAAEEKDPSELLKEPMIKEMIELFDPKKVRIRKNT